MSSKASSTPFGFKAKLFDRRRDAEEAVEDYQRAGQKSWWRVWGKKYKVYYSSTLTG